MPHVKLLGEADLAAFHRDFRPRLVREGELLLKAEECYLASQSGHLLVECSVREGHLRQGFFLSATSRDGECVVRLSSRTQPEKTAGVLRAVAWIGSWIGARSPRAALASTNLDPVLAIPFSADALAP